ncbi:M20 aminoacylase family protein [Leucothrix mucor]|uniref:M20 aminoacylase family protein n=1 Tax=Leucothrix mucor TaxID=45248 RepID=UPI0003B5A9F1|nr:M20 aminoacylase family protein [Leucothrix mucor]
MIAIAPGSALHQDMITWRHWLHQHPELCFEEFKTSDYIASVLESLEIPIHRGLGGTGIVATITGQGSGPSIGLRADIDALPVTELNDIPYKSQHPGKMHACGHDGHSTMLLGAAAYLKQNNQFNGTVHCIFQPAEEGDAGALQMIEEGLFDLFPCQEIYGMHNWPGLEAGQFAVHDSAVMAGVETLNISIHGKGGHAAMPHKTIDPVVISAQIITALQSIVSRNIAPVDSAVISITQVNAGHAHNVIPDTVNMAGTMRYFDPLTRPLVLDRIKTLVEGISASYGATGELTIIPGYPPVINSPEHAAYSANATSAVVGEDKVQRTMPPSMAAEDFAFMLQELPGAYIWIGNGEGEQGGCMLHNAHYDFNDDVAPLGASYWVNLVRQRLT